MPDSCLHCVIQRAVFDFYEPDASIDLADACGHLTEVLAELVAADPDPATRGETMKDLAEMLGIMVKAKRRRGQHPKVGLNS